MKEDISKKSKSNLLNAVVPLLKSILLPITSIIAAMIIAVFFVVWAKGTNFIDSLVTLFSAIWKGSFGTTFSISETMVFFTPLLFTGLANAVAFRTGLFNIGVEGQFTVGILTAAVVGLIPGIPAGLHAVIVLLAGTIAGAIWGAIPGFLKAKYGTSEVINTIMMNYIAMYFVNYLIMGPLNKKGSSNTYEIKAGATLWRFAGPSYRVNIGLFLGLALAFIIYFLLMKTTWGYEMRAVGLSPSAAEYGGISIKKNLVLAMVISGAVAGLGGAVHVAGIQHKAIELFAFTGFGMDGIAVALLAKSNPIGVIFSALLFGMLDSSSLNLQLQGIPKEIVYIIQAIIIMFVAADYVYKWIGERRKKKEALING